MTAQPRYAGFRPATTSTAIGKVIRRPDDTRGRFDNETLHLLPLRVGTPPSDFAPARDLHHGGSTARATRKTIRQETPAEEVDESSILKHASQFTGFGKTKDAGSRRVGRRQSITCLIAAIDSPIRGFRSGMSRPWPQPSARLQHPCISAEALGTSGRNIRQKRLMTARRTPSRTAMSSRRLYGMSRSEGRAASPFARRPPTFTCEVDPTEPEAPTVCAARIAG